MKSTFRAACLAMVAVLSLSSCIFSPKKDDPVVVGGEYREPTTPENVIWNLAESYRREEIEEYAKLLHPEFIFKFQPADLVLIEDEFWTRDQDSTGTSNLFRAPIVSEIRISLTHASAESAHTEVGFVLGDLKIRINPTFLEVDQSDGITWQVDGDLQDMFFRKGSASLGLNPDHWYILEWRDIPDPSGAPRGDLDLSSREANASAMPRTLNRVSWGQLRHRMSTN